YAALCQEQALIPIVEPEVLMDGSHSIERCEEVTGTVLHAVFRANQPIARAQTVEDYLLVWARASGSRAGGVTWSGREPWGRQAGLVPKGSLQQRGQPRECR